VPANHFDVFTIKKLGLKRQRACKAAGFSGYSVQYQPVRIGNELVIPSRILNYLTGRFAFAAILPVLVLFSVTACTVKHPAIPTDKIPKIDTLAPREAEFGKQVFEDLCDDHQLDARTARYSQLVTIFDHLIQVAKADHLPWQIHLFQDPNLADVRAVYGNYIFVWSGFLDIAENEGEIAAVVACEIAHVLARHTYPVEFTLWSDIFFDVAEITTSLAIMSLSQGMVAIGGRGWMKWAYVEVADLDPLDREYSETDEREATMIAMQILDRSKYTPEAMLTFWQRIQQDESLQIKVNRLNRELTPRRRTEIISETLDELRLKAKPPLPDNSKTGQRSPDPPTPQIQSTSKSIHPSEGS
jgi:Zn-dependent protease with chaperone function